MLYSSNALWDTVKIYKYVFISMYFILLKQFRPLRSGRFPSLCNTQKVDLDPLEDHDNVRLKNIIQDYFHYTQSTVAMTLLNDWSDAIQYFIKVS